MFTGIIEATGVITAISQQGANKTFTLRSPISHELKVDQSVAHDGVCLTVEALQNDTHIVTAVNETLVKSNIGGWRINDTVNLERSLIMNGRLDGHLVQGHVDTTAVCTGILEQSGSWLMSFSFPEKFAGLVIEKGSISLNGISLTIFDVGTSNFTVAVIPYTYTHTSLSGLKKDATVNLEFDMIGKYAQRFLELGAKKAV